MQKLYKKDVKQFISIFVKNLDILDYGNLRSKIEKYLKENKMECIITSTEKVVYAYGKKVGQYLNSELSNALKELSNTLKEQIKDIHLSSVRSSNLEIINGKFIKSIYYYEPLKDFKGIGSIIIFYKEDYSEQAYEFLTKIK